MKKWILDGAFKRLNAVEISELSDTDVIEYQKDLNDHAAKMDTQAGELKTKIDGLVESGVSATTEIDSLKEQLKAIDPESLANIGKAVKEQGLLLARLKSVNIEAAVELNPIEAAFEANKDYLKNATNTPLADANGFAIKAVVSAGSVVNNTDSLRLNDIGQLAHRKLTLYDLFPKIKVPMNSNGVVRYTDWDQATIVRAATMLAESQVFPESTAAWEEYTLDLKKVGDSIPVTEETLYDRARFAAELNLFLTTNVSLVTDQQLYNGSGVGIQMSGVDTTAGTFVTASAGIVDPSIYDLIVKMRESIMAGADSKYDPDVVLMNITDINRYKLKKDGNNNYLMPPFVDANGNRIDGVLVIESNTVVANSLTMGQTTYARIYEEESGVVVSTGVVNDQFVKDQLTLKARRRMNILVRQADRGAWLKSANITLDTAGLI